jgi:hypothetical protein
MEWSATERPLWLDFVDSIPKQYANKAPVNTGVKPDVKSLADYDIRGLTPEPVVLNPLHDWALEESNKQLTEAYDRPMKDTIDLTGFQSYCYTTTDRELWYAINYWSIFTWTLDDLLDQLDDAIELR